MKERKYRAIVSYGDIKKGEILKRYDTPYDNEYSKGYSNGLDWEFLTDEEVEPIIDGLIGINTEHKLSSYEKEVNIGNVFSVGSKWIAKCDIATYKFDTKFAWISKGETITLSYVIWDRLIFNDYSYVLSEESAKLLLEPYTEPLREMTAEQIEKEFKVKVVG